MFRKPTEIVDRKWEFEKQLGLVGTFYDYVKMAWPTAEPGIPFKDNWHLGLICEYLQAVTELQIRKLAINQPPGTGKSRITGLFWPTWTWIRDKGFSRWGCWSFDQGLVYRESGDSLELIRSPWYTKRWGDRVMVQERAPAVGNYSTTAGGQRFASTCPRGDATGFHFDYRLVDDPHKPQAISKVTLEEVRRWKYGTLPSRMRNPSTVRDVCVMQRLHELDYAGFCEKDGYTMLVLPMRYEPRQFSIPSCIQGRDPRTEPGELLWPDRFSEEVVQGLEKDLGPHQTAGQLQQRPAPEGGAIFRSEWWRSWVPIGTPAPEGALPGSWKELPQTMDETIISVDCGFKNKDDADFVCFQTWGRKGPDFFLLDEWCDRMSFSQTLVNLRAFMSRWPFAAPVLVEDKANGSAVIDTLKEEFPKIEEIQPQGGKEARAHAVTGTYNAGCIYQPAYSSFTLAHRTELLAFPFGANDDRVDCMSQAIIYLMAKFRAFSTTMSKVARVLGVEGAEGDATKQDCKEVTAMLDLLYGIGSRVT